MDTEKNEIYIPTVAKDPEAEANFGELHHHLATNVRLADQATTRTFKLPNKAATSKFQKALANVEEYKALADSAKLAKNSNVDQIRNLGASGAMGSALIPVKIGNMKFAVVPDRDDVNPEHLQKMRQDVKNLLTENPQVAAMSLQNIRFEDKEIKGIELKSIKVTNTYDGEELTVTLVPQAKNLAEQALYALQIHNLIEAKKAAQATTDTP